MFEFPDLEESAFSLAHSSSIFVLYSSTNDFLPRTSRTLGDLLLFAAGELRLEEDFLLDEDSRECLDGLLERKLYRSRASNFGHGPPDCRFLGSSSESTIIRGASPESISESKSSTGIGSLGGGVNSLLGG